MIRTVYQKDPKHPATDSHPQAIRYQFGDVWVDAIGDLTEVDYLAWALSGHKATAHQQISQAAEARRSEITAAAPGKQGAYLLKYELVLRAEGGDEAAKTLLTAEATARGLTYEQLRDVVVSKRVAWETAAMQIETVEAASKAAVATSVDRTSVDGAVATARKLLAEIGG